MSAYSNKLAASGSSSFSNSGGTNFNSGSTGGPPSSSSSGFCSQEGQALRYIFRIVRNSTENSIGTAPNHSKELHLYHARNELEQLRGAYPNLGLFGEWIEADHVQRYYQNVDLSTSTDTSSTTRRPVTPEMEGIDQLYSSQSQKQLASSTVVTSYCSPADSYVNIFILASFHTPIYTRLAKANQRIIGPALIKYWKNRLGSDGFNLEESLLKITPINRIFSECMIDTCVYLSEKIPLEVRLDLIEKIRWMSGTISHCLNFTVTHAVMEAEPAQSVSKPGTFISADGQINAAHYFELHIMSINWIPESWIHSQFQCMFADFDGTRVLDRIPMNLQPKHILSGQVIGVIDSVLNNPTNPFYPIKLDKVIMKLKDSVILFGGRLIVYSKSERPLTDWTVLLHVEQLAHPLTKDPARVRSIWNAYQTNPDYRELQHSKPLAIISLDWLVHSIIKEVIQPKEKYTISALDLEAIESAVISGGPNQRPNNLELPGYEHNNRGGNDSSSTSAPGSRNRLGFVTAYHQRPPQPNSDSSYNTSSQNRYRR